MSRESKIRDFLKLTLMPREATGGNIGLPVLPLIEIIIRYALPTPTVLTYTCPIGLGSVIADCCEWRDPVTGTPYFLTATRTCLYAYNLVDKSKSGLLELTSSGVNVKTSYRPDDALDGTNEPMTSAVCSVGSTQTLYSVLFHDGESSIRRITRNQPFSLLEIDPTRSTTSIAASMDGKSLYWCERRSNQIRRFDTASGVVSVVAGSGHEVNTDGPALTSSIDSPLNIVLNRSETNLPSHVPGGGVVRCPPDSTLYMTCTNSVRVLNLHTQQLTAATTPKHGIDPNGLTFITASLLVVSCHRTKALWTVDVETGDVTLFAGRNQSAEADAKSAPATAADSAGTVTSPDGDDGPLLTARFKAPHALCVIATPPGAAVVASEALANPTGLSAALIAEHTATIEFDGFVYVMDNENVRRVGINPQWIIRSNQH